MLRSGTDRPATPDDARGQQSLGDLVGLALKDVSQLIRHEINLAKSEFKVDARRAAFGGSAFILILLVAYPLIMMLLFAEAYALMSLGAPGGRWGAFLWTALTCVLFALIAGLIGLIFFKKVTGMQLTRKTVSADIDMLKRAGSDESRELPAAADGGGRTDAAPAAATARSLAR